MPFDPCERASTLLTQRIALPALDQLVPAGAAFRSAPEIFMFPIVAVMLLIAFQIAVTWWLWRNQTYVRAEKSAQTKLIWLLPCLGAAFVLIMLIEDARQQG